MTHRRVAVGPYPDLEESLGDEDREWGWTPHPLDVIPDLLPVVDRIRPLRVSVAERIGFGFLASAQAVGA